MGGSESWLSFRGAFGERKSRPRRACSRGRPPAIGEGLWRQWERGVSVSSVTSPAAVAAVPVLGVCMDEQI